MSNYRKIILSKFLIFSILAEFLCNLCAMTMMLSQQGQNMYVIIYEYMLNRRLNTVYCTSIYIFDVTVPLHISPCFLFGSRAVMFGTAAGCDSEPVSHLFTQPTLLRPVLQVSSHLQLILPNRHFPQQFTKCHMSSLL